MDEIRKNHIVQIGVRGEILIEGIVLDYTFDRIMVMIVKDSLDCAKNLKELDEITVFAHTHMGLKKMESTVISTLNSENCIVIENAPSHEVDQKREFVRVLSSINFKILKDSKEINCVCVNISAGGIAFYSNEEKFNCGDDVEIEFSKEYFEKDIITSAKIIKDSAGVYVAKYTNLDKYDEDKITKYVFKLVAKK